MFLSNFQFFSKWPYLHCQLAAKLSAFKTQLIVINQISLTKISLQ